MRLTIVLVLVVLAASPAVGPASAQTAGQSSGTAAPAGDLRTFMNAAGSSALLQIGAGERAVQEATRPEVKELAQGLVQLNRDLQQRLQAFAQQSGLSMPTAMMLEHQAVFDGLAPLDGEEFNRRYAETQIQALEQAARLYRAGAERSTEQGLKTLATEILPRLDQQLAAARRVLDVVRPK